jgi:hypothetical protein
MPFGKVHEAISKIRTGKPYSELHKWIDYDEKGLGSDHRKERHYYTQALKDEVKRFGEHEAIGEWLFHIALDNLDTSVTNDWSYLKRNTNFFRFGFAKDGFVYYDSEKISRDELEEEFSDTYEEGNEDDR